MKELKQPTMSSVPVCLKRVFQATSLAAKIRIKEQSHSVIVVLLLCNQVRDREPDALFWKCPSLCCYCCEETLWLKQPGKERVFFLFCFVFLFFFFFGCKTISPSTNKGSQDRNSNRAGTLKQELMQMLRRSAAYWLAPHGLLGLISYRT